MVQTLARCRSCGLPGKLAESLEWQPDGAIVFRRMKSLRLALLDAQTMDHIRAAVEAAVGADACMGAEKDATRIVTGGLTSGIKGRLSRYSAIKKRALEAIEGYSMLLGMGRIELERFTPGEGGSLLLRRPFDLGVVTAGVTGVLEEMDRCRYAGTLSGAGENVYRLVLDSDEPEGVEAASPRELPLFHDQQAGDEKIEGCRICGLPSAISQLRWDELYGTIEAGAGGRRVFFMPVYMLAVLGHLAAGVAGSRYAKAVEEAVYASTRSSLESGKSDAYESSDILPRGGDWQAAWQSMRMRGWGAVARHRLHGGDLRVTVLDAVDEALIAGWLRAIYTVAMGREPVVEIVEEPPSTVFELGWSRASQRGGNGR